MRSFRTALLLPAAAAAVAVAGPVCVTHPVKNAAEARAIAEAGTGGIAVDARRIPLNGATGGWLVDVHMPGEARGWRSVIDRDTRMVHERTRIPNPRPPRRRQ